MSARIGSMFSGMGGLDMAVSAHYGATVAWHVEFDRAPSSVLAHHYPDIPNLGDITQVDWSANDWHATNTAIAVEGGDANGSLADIDILTGGFP